MKSSEILLMAEILHQLIGSLSHYLQGFIHPRWCRISAINSRTLSNTTPFWNSPLFYHHKTHLLTMKKTRIYYHSGSNYRKLLDTYRRKIPSYAVKLHGNVVGVYLGVMIHTFHTSQSSTKENLPDLPLTFRTSFFLFGVKDHFVGRCYTNLPPSTYHLQASFPIDGWIIWPFRSTFGAVVFIPPQQVAVSGAISGAALKKVDTGYKGPWGIDGYRVFIRAPLRFVFKMFKGW